jgi:MFS family permease
MQPMLDSQPESPQTTLTTKHPLSLWRHPDFIKLWTGQTISFFGSALSRLALPLIAALTLNASAAEMGFLAAVETMPSLLVGLFVGVWVDRYPRRKLMIITDVGRAMLLGTIPVAAYLNILSMWQLYIIGFLVGVASIFFNVASKSYLPSVINRNQLVDGNSMLELSGSITSIAGPSLAGIIIQAVTAPIAIALDGVSYLASSLCVLFIRQPEVPTDVSQAPILSQVREGLGTVLHNPILRPLAGCIATSNFSSNIFFALYILFGTRELGLNAAQLGLVYGIGASGALIGAMVAPQAAEKFGVGHVTLFGALLGSLEVLPVIFATQHTAIPLLILSSLLGNFGWVVYNVNAVSIRQAVIPMKLQGRLNATMSFIMAGMLPLGALVGGALGQVLGLRHAITLAAVGSLMAFLWVLRSPIRQLTRLPEAVSDPT